MTKITQSQIKMLQAAAAAEDGFIQAPQDQRAKAAADRLIKAGLLMAAPSDGRDERLLITLEGRAAVGAPAPASGSSRETGAIKAPLGDLESAPAKGKIGVLVGLLRREGGATVADLMAATGWQAHSVRGAISGAVKKTLGLNVNSEKIGEARVYKIVETAA